MTETSRRSVLFVVESVQGCVHTFSQLLRHWNYYCETLVHVGDLLGAGKYSPEVIALARRLSQRFGERAVFLLGDTESNAIDYFEGINYQWLQQGGQPVLAAYAQRGFSLARDIDWLARLPLWWEDNTVFISHGGISTAHNPFDRHHPHGVVHHRGAVLNLGKLQIVCQQPVQELFYEPSEHCWHLGTVPEPNSSLRALRFDGSGSLLDIVVVPISADDCLQ